MATATLAVAILTSAFGIKKFKPALFGELMLKNAQNTNRMVKEAAYDYYKGVYRWIGAALLPLIEDKLKKQQMVGILEAYY